mmetsp:Transcript_6083/g.11206  ORF Transcript_6083/g.11206 Transcript_6083/m.11206 type:complete len:202 (+) Transcript_6083:1215-1820(+)
MLFCVPSIEDVQRNPLDDPPNVRFESPLGNELCDARQNSLYFSLVFFYDIVDCRHPFYFGALAFGSQEERSSLLRLFRSHQCEFFPMMVMFVLQVFGGRPFQSNDSLNLVAMLVFIILDFAFFEQPEESLLVAWVATASFFHVTFFHNFVGISMPVSISFLDCNAKCPLRHRYLRGSSGMAVVVNVSESAFVYCTSEIVLV